MGRKNEPTKTVRVPCPACRNDPKYKKLCQVCQKSGFITQPAGGN